MEQEIKLNEVKICCNKPMKSLGDVGRNFLDNFKTTSCYRYICLDCGLITDIHTYALDDEELINELENNEDKEIEESEIYKQLKKEFE